MFPYACQVLDDYHGSEYLHKVAKAQYVNPFQAQEWAEATLARLYLGKVGQVLGGLRRMQPTSDEALTAIDNCWMYLHAHRGRTTYRTFRHGGYPLGSGGMESANKFICLKPHLGWRLARVKCLSALIIALFKVKTVNLTGLATAFAGHGQSTSHYRRPQRFFQHVELKPVCVARLVVAFLPYDLYALP